MAQVLGFSGARVHGSSARVDVATCGAVGARRNRARRRCPSRQRGAAIDGRHREIELRAGIAAGQRHANRMEQRPALQPRPLARPRRRGAKRVAVERRPPSATSPRTPRPRARRPAPARTSRPRAPRPSRNTNATRSGISSSRSTDPTAIGSSDSMNADATASVRASTIARALRSTAAPRARGAPAPPPSCSAGSSTRACRCRRPRRCD